jgi:hypothetical protein
MKILDEMEPGKPVSAERVRWLNKLAEESKSVER